MSFFPHLPLEKERTALCVMPSLLIEIAHNNDSESKRRMELVFVKCTVQSFIYRDKECFLAYSLLRAYRLMVC